MKLLVVEDEPATRAFLRKGLAEEGYAVDTASTADEADEHVAVYEYDAILLDVMLPGGDGFYLCEKWRREGVSAPILFLTARDEVCDRVEGLTRGGDDYIVKPFAFEELVARARALIRRSMRGRKSPVIRAGEIQIDTDRRQVTRLGLPVSLTAREYQLLEYLAMNADRVVTRTALWEHVWESSSVPDSNVVDVYIRYLRDKLGRRPCAIETVRGAGYILRTDSPGALTSYEI